jgi:glutathione synthase/RimK-type ligase-like ATP-grasp enzyme
VWVANKTPADPTAIAWNVAQGGQFDNVRWSAWPLRVVKMAIESTLLSGLDFGGVDVMVDANNSCYVLEINSAPSLTSPYRQECVAKVFDYMVREESYATIPLPNRLGGYTKFIHPALIGDE